jgi:plastocyanin
VNYDNNGFSPQNIEVALGTKVTFINTSDIPMWVASDPHPEHTNYPAFDTPAANNGKMPELNENFTFVFDKEGVWNYHSHLASSDIGTEEVHPGTVTVRKAQ